MPLHVSPSPAHPDVPLRTRLTASASSCTCKDNFMCTCLQKVGRQGSAGSRSQSAARASLACRQVVLL
eukprot:1158723-Pelagomonas_calceolata.AAC.7